MISDSFYQSLTTFTLSAIDVERRNVFSGHVFSWEEPTSWLPKISLWLSDKFKKKGVGLLRPSHYRDLYADDIEWLEILGSALKGGIDNYLDDLADDLEASNIIAYHGTRADNIKVYFEEGILSANEFRLKRNIENILKENKNLTGIKSHFEKLINSSLRYQDEGRVFLAADKRELLNHSSHYLIYGSEWLLSIFGERREVLKSIGIPTLFEISLPLSMVGFNTRRELAIKMLNEWTRFVCNHPEKIVEIDFTFVVREAVPASNIIGHSHPVELKDQHERGRIYRPRESRCKHCM